MAVHFCPRVMRLPQVRALAVSAQDKFHRYLWSCALRMGYSKEKDKEQSQADLLRARGDVRQTTVCFQVRRVLEKSTYSAGHPANGVGFIGFRA